jgi:hypothetical protein
VSDFSSEKFISKVRFSVAVSVERVVGRCRLNVNVYPVTLCVVSLYTGVKLPINTNVDVEDVVDSARIGVPVSFRAISDCMRVYFYRSSPELVRRGLIPAVGCLGYVEAVEGRYRVKYVPTLMGVIDSAIYLALFNTLLSELDKYGIKLSPETVHALVRFMRFMVFWELLSEYEKVPYILSEKLYYMAHDCDRRLSQGSCSDDLCEKVRERCEGAKRGIERLRGELLHAAVITKTIAGVEVEGFDLRQLGNVFMKVYNVAGKYAERFIKIGDSAEDWRKLRGNLQELFSECCLNEPDAIKLLEWVKALEVVHSFYDVMASTAAIRLTIMLMGNLSKPVTPVAAGLENKQSRLRR